MLAMSAELADRGVDFDDVLAEMIEAFHGLAVGYALQQPGCRCWARVCAGNRTALLPDRTAWLPRSRDRAGSTLRVRDDAAPDAGVRAGRCRVRRRRGRSSLAPRSKSPVAAPVAASGGARICRDICHPRGRGRRAQSRQSMAAESRAVPAPPPAAWSPACAEPNRSLRLGRQPNRLVPRRRMLPQRRSPQRAPCPNPLPPSLRRPHRSPRVPKRGSQR